MLTTVQMHDIMNELRVKHGQHKMQRDAKPDSQQVACCVLLHNNPLQEP